MSEADVEEEAIFNDNAEEYVFATFAAVNVPFNVQPSGRRMEDTEEEED